ncbi:TDRKH protein, partial [Menura novaehollandiae]|nr:TDRKH protein [Menura novaehollandiae]
PPCPPLGTLWGPAPVPTVPSEAQVTFVGDEGLEVGVRVPRTALKSLIGRKGATINQLRRETGARIDVEEDEEEDGGQPLVQISGSPGQVCRAKAAVLRIVADSAPVAEQLRVPNRAVGRIIGRGGETVRGICRSSGARVECGHDPDGGLASLRVIRLLGTRKEVAAAKKLILEKLSEDAALRRELAQAAAARCPRKQPLGSRREPGPLPDGMPEGWEERWDVEWAQGEPLPGRVPGGEPRGGSEELETEGVDEELEELEMGDEELQDGNGEPGEPPVPKFEGERSGSLPSHGASRALSAVPSPDFSFQADEHLDVYVSAAENPSHFWIQILGNRSLQLDKLTAEMGQFYQSSPPAPPPSVHPGDIVAAPYLEDGEWYRARVLGTLDNGHLDLYYVDFGDNGEAPPEALRALRSDFLSLPFQAIECSLAGIVPNGERGWDTALPLSCPVPDPIPPLPAGNAWEEAALDEFDRLTHCAQWTPLVARISSYSQSGLCPRPSVQLF